MRTDFINFADIDLSRPETWRGKKILSFDIDWAIDEAIEECLLIVLKAGVKATFFVTHDTPILDTLKNSKGIELGIHPNFDGLINKNVNSKTSDEIIKDLKVFTPSAQVIRSHGMTHSGRWLPLYQANQIKFSSQYFMNGVDTIQPFSHLNGIIEAPVYFADDGLIWESDKIGLRKAITRFSLNGINNFLCVYNFHPIHVALNCSSYKDYIDSKNDVLNKNKIQWFSEKRSGVKNILIELLK